MSYRSIVTATVVLLSGGAMAQPAGDGQPAPLASITGAPWSAYQDMYVSSPLCRADEITLWRCDTTRKRHALCASRQLTRDSGYLQYRVSEAGDLAFVFPATQTPPFGLFTYSSSPRGDASLAFSSGGRHYSLVDPLRGSSLIDVAGQAPDTADTQEVCQNANQTLQLNYTLKLMYEAGIWQGYQ